MTAPIVVGVGLLAALGNCTSQLFTLSTTALAGMNLTSQALDLTTFLGVFGLFTGSVGWLLLRRPLVPLRDPRLPESVAFENF